MIVISAGHDPNSPGACDGDFCEYPETALWAGLIARHIAEVYRAQVAVCPNGTLKDKVRWINELDERKGVQLAVEVHFNSAPGGQARGCETLYYPGSAAGRWYAERINPAMAAFTDKDRGVKEGWHHSSEPGDKVPLYFLKATPCPALIIEPEFIQHRELITQNRQAMCEALAEAITEAVEERLTGR